MKTLTGFTSQYSIEKGLQETINWFLDKENIKLIFIMYNQVIDFIRQYF